MKILVCGCGKRFSYRAESGPPRKTCPSCNGPLELKDTPETTVRPAPAAPPTQAFEKKIKDAEERIAELEGELEKAQAAPTEEPKGAADLKKLEVVVTEVWPAVTDREG